MVGGLQWAKFNHGTYPKLCGRRWNLWFRALPEIRTKNTSGLLVAGASHCPTGRFLKALSMYCAHRLSVEGPAAGAIRLPERHPPLLPGVGASRVFPCTVAGWLDGLRRVTGDCLGLEKYGRCNDQSPSRTRVRRSQSNGSGKRRGPSGTSWWTAEVPRSPSLSPEPTVMTLLRWRRFWTMLWPIAPDQHRKNRNICVRTRPLTANRPAW